MNIAGLHNLPQVDAPLFARLFDPLDLADHPRAMSSVPVGKPDAPEWLRQHPVPPGAPAAVLGALGPSDDGRKMLRIQREVEGHFSPFRGRSQNGDLHRRAIAFTDGEHSIGNGLRPVAPRLHNKAISH